MGNAQGDHESLNHTHLMRVSAAIPYEDMERNYPGAVEKDDMDVFNDTVLVATVDIILDAPLRDPLRARAAMQHFNSYLDDYEKRLRAVSRGKSVAALSTEFSVEYLRVAITGTSHRHAAQTFLESIKELRVNLNREVFRVW